MENNLLTLLVLLLVLGGSVFLHELGHFLAARWMNIEVEEFGFGFPPKILTLFHWQGTEFSLNWIPLGGFVRPKGENDPNVTDGLAAAAPLKRLVVLFAGPLMNLLTAFVIFTFIISQQGIPTPKMVTISEVMPASPAQAAGFQANDRLISINGVELTTVKDASQAIRAGVDTTLNFVIERGGQTITLSATPLSSRKAPLGVSISAPLRPASPLEALSAGAEETYYQIINTALIPVSLIRQKISPQEARPIGLVGMFNIFGQAIQRDSESRQTPAPSDTSSAARPTNWVLSIAAMLAVSLGVFNLYPIPALDGGRILFTLPELFLNRRIPYQMENIINGVAFLLLIGLMIIINSWDVIDPANIILPK
ncbi:MAG: M50 family metallopeptidase [Anaerolineales bacterium]